MITVFCVLVKPKYSVDDVVKLRDNLTEHLKYNFNMICLSDREFNVPGVEVVDVSSFDLETWWNKVLIFDKSISRDVNLYFDLDIKIHQDITPLIEQLDNDNITVVDTPWKDKKYFDQKLASEFAYRRSHSFLHYGNTSVMGWKGDKQYIVDLLLSDVFTHTSQHFGDDTFINKHAKVNYFKFDIQRFVIGMPTPAITINYNKSLPV